MRSPLSIRQSQRYLCVLLLSGKCVCVRVCVIEYVLLFILCVPLSICVCCVHCACVCLSV